MKILFTFFVAFLILFSQISDSAFCKINQDDILYMNPDGSFSSENAIPFAKIKEIERKIFKKDFATENVDKRLSRLEKSIFKKTQNNLSSKARAEKIIDFIDKKEISDPNLDALSKMERKIFGTEISTDTIERRLERLEINTFGTFQDGNHESRIRKLKTALLNDRENIEKYSYNNEEILPHSYNSSPSIPQILPNSQAQNQWRYKTRTNNNPFFQGAMTGYTIPPYYVKVPNRTPITRAGKRRAIAANQHNYIQEQMSKIHQNFDEFFGNVYPDSMHEFFSTGIGEENYGPSGYNKYKSKSIGGASVKIIRD